MIHDSICGLIENKVCVPGLCHWFTLYSACELVSLVYTLQCLPACVIGLHCTVLANSCQWFTLDSACQLVSLLYTLPATKMMPSSQLPDIITDNSRVYFLASLSLELF